MMKNILIICFLQVWLITAAAANIADRDDVQTFLKQMNQAHGFSEEQLKHWFKQVKISDAILKAISRPAEKLSWYQYRPIFLKSKRIKQGTKFWKRHAKALARAEKEFGVPAEIIVAIIGVETFYGRNTGHYRVLDSLATLAFDYPKRSRFFKTELEQYLLLTREQNVDPLALQGSYAGAMGIPQFISSSYRNYAVDFDGDGRIDIWNNPVDAIGSVANYFKRHGWKPGKTIAVNLTAVDDKYKVMINEKLEPEVPYTELVKAGVSSEIKIPDDEKVKLIELELEDGVELWAGLHNFYVITRYNHSTLYAMAVYQLSSRIKSMYQSLSD